MDLMTALFASQLNESINTELPSVDNTDNGKILEVINGEWNKSDALDDIESDISDVVSEIVVERARIDNIVALPEGSTTGDAELMDIRVGADGKTYPTAGDSVRGNDNRLQAEIDDIFLTKMDKGYTETAKYTTTEKGLMRHDNGNIDFSDSTNYRHITIAYNSSKYYKFTAMTFNNNLVYSAITFLNSNSEVIGYYPKGAQNVTYEDEYLAVPSGTSYICVNGNVTTQPIIKEGNFETTDATLENKYKELSATLYVKDTIFTKETGLYNTYDLTQVITWGGYSKVKYEVTPGAYYVVTCQTINTFSAWIFGDENNVVLENAEVYNNRVYTNKVLKAPPNAKYLYLNGKDADVTIKLYKTDNDAIIDILSRVNTLENAVNPIIQYSSYLCDFVNTADMIKRTRAGGKSFSYSGLNNGYLTLIFDDGRHDISTVLSICNEYNIPLCAAIPTSALNDICDNNKTVKEVCDDIITSGGEILSHSYDWTVLTDANNITWLKAALMGSKETLTGLGYNVRGFIRPSGTGAIDWRENNLQRFTQLFYDYSDQCGDEEPYYKPRWGVGSLTIQEAKAVIDDIALNNKWYTTMMHTLDGTEGNLSESYLRELIEYALSKGILFKTYAYMYDNFSQWT